MDNRASSRPRRGLAAIRAWGITSLHVAACVPELDSRELSSILLPKALASSQLALTLRLGSQERVLPSLHAGAGFYDATERIEVFRRALRVLDEARAAHDDDAQDPDRDFAFPKMSGTIEQMAWASGRGSALLRLGIEQGLRGPRCTGFVEQSESEPALGRVG